MNQSGFGNTELRESASDADRLIRLPDDVDATTAAAKLDPVVHETDALEETDQAFADTQARDAIGKLVVEPQR